MSAPAAGSVVSARAARAAALLLLAGLPACRPAPRPEPAPAAELSAAVSVSAETVRVGDPVRVELAVVHPAEGTLDLPEPAAAFEVRRRETRAEPAGPGRLRHRAVYDLISFELGTHAVFEGRVVHVAPGGGRRETPVEGGRVEVRPVLQEAGAAPRDPKPPMPWPPAVPRWTWALPVVLLAALLSAFGIRWWMRRRDARPAPPPPPPDAVALSALARLRARGWIEAGAAEPFFVELSRIVREYLEARFALRAPELTTEEFLRAAAASAALAPAPRARAAGFLEQCDLVKFARIRPAAAGMEGAFAAAGQLVRETAPAAAPAGEAAP